MLNQETFKIFFLFPQKLIFEDIIEKLVSLENESFVLNNHVEFRDALRIFNKNTIAFINIDSLLSEKEWIDYVRTLRDDPHFSRIKIGILSFNPDARLMNIYKNDLHIECGYHLLSTKNQKFETDVLQIVEKYSKGKRNPLLRLDFEKNEPVDVKIKSNGQTISGDVNTLTSAAMSLTVENESLLKKGMRLDQILVTYNNHSAKVAGVVIGNSQSDKRQFIIKFDQLYNEIHQNPLRKIIQSALDLKLREMVK
jgi:hypothetical protein